MSNIWYEVANMDDIDTPTLLVYEDRVKKNIDRGISYSAGVDFLRPHVKTSKMAVVCQWMQEARITKFKCATVAEAEMLAGIGAPDVLLAYALIGPKINRFLSLIQHFPDTKFSCLVDSIDTASVLGRAAEKYGIAVDIWLDVNVGMNRTGTPVNSLDELLAFIDTQSNLGLRGVHAYDGHIHDTDMETRQKAVALGYDSLARWITDKQQEMGLRLEIVVGGSPSFPIHAQREGVEASPGTFVFWDTGYQKLLPEQAFDFAALVATRVISVIDEEHLCVDLGHKAVAAENPLRTRVTFLNLPETDIVSQSEEHLVLKVADTKTYPVGTVLYGVPVHICPTVALYEAAWLIKDGLAYNTARIARDRKITF